MALKCKAAARVVASNKRSDDNGSEEPATRALVLPFVRRYKFCSRLVLEKLFSCPYSRVIYSSERKRDDAEVNRALELIRQRSPKLALGTITNIYERGIIVYLTLCLRQSNPRKLWKTVRNATVDQLGIVQPKEQFDMVKELPCVTLLRNSRIRGDVVPLVSAGQSD